MFLLPLKIGFRFSKARKSSSLAKFISLASTMGIAIGVAVLIIGLSAMNGFERELDHRVLGITPGAEIISSTGAIKDSSKVINLLQQVAKIKAASPNIIINGLIHKDNVYKPIQVRGIEPSLESKVLGINEFIQDSKNLEVLNDENPDNLPGIIIGDLIAKHLHVKIGDNIEFINAESSDNGSLKATLGTIFKVKAIFKIGGQLDGLISFIHINSSQKILDLPRDSATQFSVKLYDIFNAQEDSREATRYVLDHYMGGFYVQSWMLKYGNLYRDIQMIRTILYLALVLIVAVACFNIISSLVMAINDKRSEIAILMSLGYKRGSVLLTFITSGIISGIIGALIGAIIGSLSATYLTEIVNCIQNIFGIQILKQEVYFINFIPSEVHILDILLVVGVAFILTIVATIIPSYMSTKINPAKELSGK
ncbi:MAG: lipoprotein-releasing ABC transporter permease subunit [Succinivibrionaceae bacterium]